MKRVTLRIWNLVHYSGGLSHSRIVGRTHVNFYRFFGNLAVNVIEHENNEGLTVSDGESAHRIAPTVKRDVENALLDYLHSTRSLPFLDAEHMTKNSPQFSRKLAENVRYEPDVKRSMARFLRYHPINEFEPFFESIGLEPYEYMDLLPRDLMYLSDADGLLDNYYVLCEFGIGRDKIGKIYREAGEVFRYEYGILQSKLRAFEMMGIGRHVVGKAVSFNPTLLVSGMSRAFFELIRMLKCWHIEYDWVDKCLVENGSYNWRQIIELLHVLNDIGCKDEEMKKLISKHPEILFDQSGKATFLLIGFLVKFGSKKNDLYTLFSQFPQVKVWKFGWNLRRVSELLCEIDMDTVSIGRILRTHSSWLGTCTLKKANSILANMNTRKKRLCDIILGNPLELKNWTLRAKIERLPETRETCSRRDKVKFLLSIGFSENSKEIEKALKVFRGKGEELRERFECLVQAGLSEDDVSRMVKAAPQTLNQSIDVLEAKIDLLVNYLGYPVSVVKPFPGYLSYTMERVRLRFAMYKWLVNQNAVRSTLSLSTIVAGRESAFVEKYVNKHPSGPAMWQEFKQNLSSVKIF